MSYAEDILRARRPVLYATRFTRQATHVRGGPKISKNKAIRLLLVIRGETVTGVLASLCLCIRLYVPRLGPVLSCLQQFGHCHPLLVGGCPHKHSPQFVRPSPSLFQPSSSSTIMMHVFYTKRTGIKQGPCEQTRFFARMT